MYIDTDPMMSDCFWLAINMKVNDLYVYVATAEAHQSHVTSKLGRWLSIAVGHTYTHMHTEAYQIIIIVSIRHNHDASLAIA